MSVLVGTRSVPFFHRSARSLVEANGAKLITVDPRETPLARTADIHVPLRPGTDAAFFNGVLHVVVKGSAGGRSGPVDRGSIFHGGPPLDKRKSPPGVFRSTYPNPRPAP